MLSCILCNVKCGNSSSSEENKSSSDFIKAHKSFYVFCKYLEITTPEKHGKDSKWKFNFTKEPLPFCSSCLKTVDEMVHLDDELDRIHSEILLLAKGFRARVKKIHDQENKKIRTPKRLKQDQEDTTTSSTLTTTRKTTDPRILNVRNRILGVQIENDDENNSDYYDGPLSNFSHEDGSDDDVSIEEIEQVPTTKKTRKRKIGGKINLKKVTTNTTLETNEQSEENSRQSCITKISSVTFIGEKSGDDGSLDVGETVTIITEGTENNDNPEQESIINCTSSTTNTVRKARRPYKPRIKSEEPLIKPKSEFTRRIVTKIGDGKFVFEGVEFSKTESGNFQCSVCPNILKTRDSALVHIKQRHLGEGLGSFLCHQCGKNFDRLAYLRTHEVLHSNVKAHNCPTCGRCFAQRTNLYNHMKIHDEGFKTQVCELCGRRFITKGQMRLHMKMHLGDRPHHCSECNKSFVRSYDLVLHRRVHTGERPHQCQLCTSRFYTKYRLNRHVTNVHRADKAKGVKSKQGKAEEDSMQQETVQQQLLPIQVHIQSEPITFYELL